MVLMGIAQYAKHRGIDKSSVSQMITEGKLDGALKIYQNGVDSKGNPKTRTQIFWEKADRILEGYEDPTPKDHTKAIENSSAMGTLTKARTAKTAIDAQTARLKYEQLAGSLVKKDDVIQAAKEIGRVTKESLLTLPDRLAPVLAGESDINEVHRILSEEINTALRSISSGNFNLSPKEEEEEDAI